MSKIVAKANVTLFNVRDDKNAPIPNYFIVKDNVSKEYVIGKAIAQWKQELASTQPTCKELEKSHPQMGKKDLP